MVPTTLYCCGCGHYNLNSVSELNQATPEPLLPRAVLCMRSIYYIYITWGKREDGVNRSNGKCITNAVSTTDWPHFIAS